MNFFITFLCLILLISFVSGSDRADEDVENPASTARSEPAPNSSAFAFEIDLPKKPVTLLQYRSSYMILALIYNARILSEHSSSKLAVMLSNIFSVIALYFVYIYFGFAVDIIHDDRLNLYHIKLNRRKYPEATRVIPYENWSSTLAPLLFGIIVQSTDIIVSELNRGLMTLMAILIIYAIEVTHRLRMHEHRIHRFHTIRRD